MTTTKFEVFWKTKTAKCIRSYSRIFSTAKEGVAFLDGKKRPTTEYGFVREIAVTYDERGRADEIRFIRLVKVIANL